MTGKNLFALHAHAALAILLLGIAAGHARAAESGPSYDCTKAAASVDRAVCAEPALAEIDRDLETAFRRALRRDPENKATLLQDQRHWLATRAPICGFLANGEAAEESSLCLVEMYQARITLLQQRKPSGS